MSKLFTYLSLLCLLSYGSMADIILKSGAHISEKKIFVRLYNDNIDILRQNENIKIEPVAFLPKSLSIKQTDLTAKSYSLQQIKQIEKAEEPLFRTYILPVPNGSHPVQYCQYLKEKYTDYVEIAEPYYLMQKMGSTPNDPDINKQNMLVNIKALEAWLIYDGSSDITIGISDIGINQDHPDIENNIAFNTNEIPDNGIDEDNNLRIDDYRGCNLANAEDGIGLDNTYHSDQHGTEVAGIAGATYNNSTGIAGIGGKSKIFPIKIAAQNSGSLNYSYESIRYAALRELDVLNCSWGSVKDFSYIDQSIIDFAVSKGVVIVASAGNASRSEVLDRNSTIFFPAGYDGVLGVGEVNNVDKSTSESMFGSQVRVVAPGMGNYTTSGSSYTQVLEGSSYASPVISGAVALAKGRHPSLNANQLIEFVRQCTDDITSKNGSVANLIPGRINLVKVVTLDPLSLAGIRYEGKQYFSKSGKEQSRILLGETYNLKLKTRNYLGAIKNARFVLSQAYDPQNAIEVIKSEVNIDDVNAATYLGLNGFEFKVQNESYSPVVMRVDVYADGGYHDFFKFDIVPTQNYITFQNGDLTLSFGDRGEFGYTGSETQYGAGFLYKENYNQLSIPGSGLIFSAGDSKASFSYLGHFKTVSPWNNNDNSCIVSDEFAGNNVAGIEIKQQVSFPNDFSNVVQIDFTIYNKSNGSIANPSCGYYLDWDVNENYEKNMAKYFSDAIPPVLMGQENFAVEMMKENQPNRPIVAAAVFSKESFAVAQAAGLGSTDIKTEQIIELLNSGTSKQVIGFEDRAIAIGMRFKTNLEAGDSLKFIVLLAAAETETDLSTAIKSVAEGFVSVAEEPITKLSVYPNPARDDLNIRFEKTVHGQADIEIISVDGISVASLNTLLSGNLLNVDISKHNLTSGTYFIKIKIENEIFSGKISVVK